jgi:23S rRNA pseudouridine1911/1915/1917 synthase
MREIKIIYEDNDIIVCHKPAGVATEGARVGSMDVVSFVRNYLARKERKAASAGKPKPPYVATVSRLDQPVEGVLVLAKTKAAATSLSEQIKEKTTDKYYYALVYGKIDEAKAHLTNNIARKESDGNAIILTDTEKSSFENETVTLESGERCRLLQDGIKTAELEYTVINSKSLSDHEISLLDVKLLTGRYHQIRAQLSYLGHPILGDQKYGSADSKAFSESQGIKDVCLVCYKFAFDHPKTGKRTEFSVKPYNPQIGSVL